MLRLKSKGDKAIQHTKHLKHKPGAHVEVVEEVRYSHDAGGDDLYQLPVIPVCLYLILYCYYPRHSYRI